MYIYIFYIIYNRSSNIYIYHLYIFYNRSVIIHLSNIGSDINYIALYTGYLMDM